MATTTVENFDGASNVFSATGNGAAPQFIQNDGSTGMVFRGKSNGQEQTQTNLDTSNVATMDVSFSYYELDTMDSNEGVFVYVDGVAAFRLTHGAKGTADPPSIQILDATKAVDIEVTELARGNFSGSTSYGGYTQGQDALFEVSFTATTPGATATIGFGARTNQNDEAIAIDNFSAAPTPPPPCFTSGALIQVGQGQRIIDDLRPGDLVQTRDNGLQPIRWIGRRHISGAVLALAPKLRPIAIRAPGAGRACFGLAAALHGDAHA